MALEQNTLPTTMPAEVAVGGRGRSSLDPLKTFVEGSTAAGIWAIVDQACVSGGNFLTNIVLARFLGATDYGRYAVLFGVMLALNSFHRSFCVYPLSVIGAKVERHELRRLLASALALSTAGALPLGIVVVVVCWVLGIAHLAMLAFAALLAWQLQEVFRRALLAHLRHRAAILGDTISYLGQGALVLALAHTAPVTLGSVLLVMTLTSLVAGAVQMLQVGIEHGNIEDLRAFSRRCWQLGRLPVVGSFVAIFTIQAVTWMLALFRGTTDVARLQAVANLLGVTHPIMLSLGGLIVPATARTARFGLAVARRTALHYGLHGAVMFAPYVVLLLAVPRFALGALYGASSPYAGLGTETRVFALAYVLIFLSEICFGFLNGVELIKQSLIAQVAGSVTTLAAGLPLIARFGLRGAIVTVLLANTVRVAISGRYFLFPVESVATLAESIES